MQNKIVIGITDCKKYDTYHQWIAEHPDKRIEIIRLSHHSQNLSDLRKCHGIVLSGGEDVHPRFYNKPEYYEFCDKDDVSELRDEFEWRVLDYTEKNNLPVLGICRGLQVGNVYFGGTLIPHLPAWGKDDHSKYSNGQTRYHTIQIQDATLLHTLAQQSAGNINSYHHQGVEILGNGLMVTAQSEDGVVEAIERSPNAKGGFLLLVQWHPERMEQQQTPLAAGLRRIFMEAVEG
ncbi:gamma-glutamyl-gamma-aminobutyrate hydrolase family protein [Sphingobacteriales bacterium UPWRP_1]|nr:peptidase C26 [Sphingobacteriales bacterium TSM_CSS]PSJ77392.1 gamma-glutamyl-gamma-aminobutyrate hydrolase family protein [Sphingobacteriales bacterium UPWRP_1]